MDNERSSLPQPRNSLYLFCSRRTWANTRRTLLLQRPQPEPMLCSLSDAASILGISRTSTYLLVSTGRLVTVSIGRRRLVKLDSVRAIANGGAAND